MHDNFVFIVRFGPVDDFKKEQVPTPTNPLTISEQREAAIRACVNAFESAIKAKVKGDESVIHWYVGPKELIKS